MISNEPRHPGSTPNGGRRSARQRSESDIDLGAEGSSQDDWPGVQWEDRAWKSKIPAELLGQAVRQRHSGPYRAALVAPIADRAPHIPVGIATLADEATAEIARFDAELGGEVAPFASILLRSESAASSEIENLSSGAKSIALAELGNTDKRNAIEIVGNVAAMTAALDLADRLDESAIIAMHAALMARHDPSIAGRWREEQVWIGGTSIGPHEASFVAPHHERVPELMSDLVRFAQGRGIPTLTQAAIAHAQFETIHPFLDGNGRTGRALIHSMLRSRGLTRNVTVPVSAGLLTDTRAYFDTLADYREGDPSAIVEKLSNASLSAIVNGRQLVATLHEVRDGWEDKITARRGSGAWRLADTLLRQPIIDVQTTAAALHVTPENALRSIGTLADVGIITEFTGFARNRMWQSRQVLDALDAFAKRAGRRGGL